MGNSTFDITYHGPNGMLQLLLLLALLIPLVFFLLTQQRTLQTVKPENRMMSPGLVWLQLIPIVGQIWQFFVVVRIANSIKNELVGQHDDELFGKDAALVTLGNKRPTLMIGLAYSLLMWAAILTLFAGVYIDLTGGSTDRHWTLNMCMGFLAMLSPIFWVVYWISLTLWKRRLKQRASLATA